MKNRNESLRNAVSSVRGYQAKVAKLLNVSPQTVSERLNDEKEIDSVSLILAVCQVTGRDFSEFVDYTIQGETSVVQEPHISIGLKQEVEDLKRRVTELEKKLTQTP